MNRKKIKLYNDPLHFEMIPIQSNQIEKLRSISEDADSILDEFEGMTLLRFYSSIGCPTDQVTWNLFEEARTEIQMILPDSCFVIDSPEFVREILFDQGFSELMETRCEKVELEDYLLLSPTDQADKMPLLPLLPGPWLRLDFQDAQGLKEILYIHEDAENLQFLGNMRLILPHQTLSLMTFNKETLDRINESESVLPKGTQIRQFRDESFMRFEIYGEKKAAEKYTAVHFSE